MEDCPKDSLVSVVLGDREKLVDLRAIPIPNGAAAGAQRSILTARIPCIEKMLDGGFKEAASKERFIMLPLPSLWDWWDLWGWTSQ